MDQRNKVIIFGGVGLLIFAVVLVSLFYFFKFSEVNKDTQPVTNVPNSLSRLPTIVTTPSVTDSINPTVSSPAISSDDEIFKGQGFSLSFPNKWGRLTCSNSTNFEFDPSGRDMINVVCDEALKPVTFLVVDKLNCSGESIKLGNNQVTRIKILGDEGRVFYRWCTMVGNIGFDITHRVSPTGSRATSKDDFSKEIEKIIISLSKD